MTLIDRGELTASVSEAGDRVANLFDGDLDTRWIAGIGGQDGSSWVRVQLARPADIARVELRIAERSIGDYPRCCASRADRQGQTQALYDGAPYPNWARLSSATAPIRHIVRLRHNSTAAIWIQANVPLRASWSIHELRLWRYDLSGGIRW